MEDKRTSNQFVIALETVNNTATKKHGFSAKNVHKMLIICTNCSRQNNEPVGSTSTNLLTLRW